MKYFSLSKTFEENKKIFYEYSKKYHPDTNKGDVELFKELKQYYDKYIVIYDNLAWIKKELNYNMPKIVKIEKPIIIKEKIINEEILNSSILLFKQINKTIKKLSK